MSVKDAVVLRFQEILKERQMSVNRLADLSGVTPSTVYSMMSDSRRELSITTIKKLCDGLDLSLSDFFTSEFFQCLEQEIQ